MSIFDKSRYIRSFGLLFFGIGLFVICLKGQFPNPSISNLNIINGAFEKIEVKQEYSKTLKETVERRYLFLKGHNEGYIIGKLKKYKKIESNFEIGDSITIWQNVSNYPYIIEQFSNGNTIIFKYRWLDYSYVFFGLFGLVTAIVSLTYIIKHPEDLFVIYQLKKNNKMTKFRSKYRIEPCSSGFAVFSQRLVWVHVFLSPKHMLRLCL